MNPKIKKTPYGFYVMAEDSHLSRWAEHDGRLDHARNLLAKFRHLIPTGGFVIDVGAMIGDHTKTYAEYVGPTGTVWAFEANPDVAECCELNMQEYPWVYVFPVGLSDAAGFAALATDINIGASHISPKGNIGVTLKKLDDYDIKRCDFIKVDIEGFEPRFLDGAVKTITRCHPVILMEINEGALARQNFDSLAVYNRLTELGYDWAEADGKFGTPQYDIIAIPKKF